MGDHVGQPGQIGQARGRHLHPAGGIGHHHMGDHPEDAALELPLETVHHRDDHHQGRDPDGDAEGGEEGDE
ncbi:hypothetical protein D3C85_1537480 [compost metagenome]